MRFSGSSTGVVYGIAAALEAYLQGAGAVRYTGAPNAFGDGVATMTLIGNDGEDQTTFGTININLSDVVDTQIGGSGNDRLTGDNGQDVLIGNGGNDLIRGGAGADTMAGGEGIDWLQYTGSDAGVTVDLNADPVTGMQAASGGDAEGDGIMEFENILGSSFDDFLIGDAGRNVIYGGDGDDLLAGWSGNDVLNGGAGADGFIFVIDSTNPGNPQIGGGDVATVLDFTATDDSILIISISDPAFTLDVLPENIVSNANGQAETVDQFIIYNTTTGELSFDFDANGTVYDAAVFADIGLDHTLTVDNFAFL